MPERAPGCPGIMFPFLAPGQDPVQQSRVWPGSLPSKPTPALFHRLQTAPEAAPSTSGMSVRRFRLSSRGVGAGKVQGQGGFKPVFDPSSTRSSPCQGFCHQSIRSVQREGTKPGQRGFFQDNPTFWWHTSVSVPAGAPPQRLVLGLGRRVTPL